jgi:putative oxidoreductase
VAQPHSKSVSFGLLLIRVMVGVVFIFHGSQKLFGAWGGPGLDGFAGFLETMGVPYPHTSAVLAGLAEFLGGISLVTGAFLRLLAIPLMFTMVVAILTAGSGKGFDAQKGGIEYPLTLLVVVAALAIMGSGEYALMRRRAH